MPNRFYITSFVAVADTLIRSSGSLGQYASVEAGLDMVQTELNAALRGPNGETIARMPDAAARANKSLVFDSAGAPQVSVAASSAEMAAAVAAALAAAASAAAAEAAAATLAGSVNLIHRMQLLTGVL